MITLRDYQNDLTDKVLKEFGKGNKHVLATEATGGGKTIVFCSIAQRAVEKGGNVLILTNRTELLTQTGGSLENFNLKPCFIQAGTKYINPAAKCFVAMAQTLRQRLKDPKNDYFRKWLAEKKPLLIIDECHLQEFNFIFTEGYADSLFVVGFSATPKRSGKMAQLALSYDTLIEGVGVKGLINKGYLVNCDTYAIEAPDTSNFGTSSTNGDFKEADMFSHYNSAKLYSGVVKNWLNICANTQTIVFCVNIEHTIKTCEEFVNNGISAKFLVSAMSKPKMPSENALKGKWVRYEEKMRLYNLYKEKHYLWSGQRSKIIKDFKQGEFKVLVNAGIATTGFDAPNIETVILNRATQSVSLYLQMIGRGSRLCHEIGKTHFNFLDFGGNEDRLGTYSERRLFSLWHENNATGTGVPPMKDCAGCERPIMASIDICPFCGYKKPVKELKEVVLKGVLIDEETQQRIVVTPVSKMTDTELLIYFKTKGHKTAWLWRVLWLRGGVEKLHIWAKENRWSKKTLMIALSFIKKIEENERR